MAVKIGHASLDENRDINGGKAGDQTKGEVCIRTWYSKPWTLVIRPVSERLAEKSARACEKGCKNDKIGYDQYQRNTLYEQARKVGFDLSKIKSSCETDCSAFMHVCAIAGGANIAYTSNAVTTSTMAKEFVASGSYKLLTGNRYLNSDRYLKRGDILVKPGSHTVMVLEDGSATKAATTTKNPYEEPITIIEKGSKGEGVRWVQWHLKRHGYDLGEYGVDGDCGPTTVKAIKAFQKNAGIAVDGQCGIITRTHLKK